MKLKEFLFHETEEMKSKEEVKSTKTDGADPSKPRCTGVKLADGRIISVGDDDDSSVGSGSSIENESCVVPKKQSVVVELPVVKKWWDKEWNQKIKSWSELL